MKKVTKKMQGGKRVAILSSPLDPPSLQTRVMTGQGSSLLLKRESGISMKKFVNLYKLP